MDQSHSVHLKWNKHQDTLVSIFDALLDSEKLTDCTISAEGQHLKAHKIILSACSPYFEELFTVNYEKHPIIILHDVKYDVVKALMDFMYRGEVNVPQEQLSTVLKLLESLQVRGISGSTCVEDVNKQKGSGRNTPPVPPEILPSQPVTVDTFISGDNEPEEKLQSFRGCSPIMACQAADSVGGTAIQKYRKCNNNSSSDQRTSQNVFQEVPSPDVDSGHKPPPHRQALPTTCSSTGGPIFSSIPVRSVCNDLQSRRGETVVGKNKRFLVPEAVVSDKRSASLSANQPEVVLETKSEVLESHMEIVEDLTLDDDENNDYHDSCNSAKDDIRDVISVCEGATYEDDFLTQRNSSVQSQFGNDCLNSMTLTIPNTVLRNRFSCNSCGKSYTYLENLKRHKRHECGKEPQFQCPHCNKRCARKDNLKQHMATHRFHMMHNNYGFFEEDV